MKYLLPLLIFIVGCSTQYKQIQTQRAEKTRQGIDALSVLMAEVQRSNPQALIRSISTSLKQMSLIIKGLSGLWGIPVKPIKTDEESIKKWAQNTRKVTIKEREIKEKLLFERLKKRAKVGGGIKLGFLIVSFVGLIIGTIYVRIQYGKLGAWVLGVVGGLILLGYVVITYKTLIIYGGLVLAGMTVIYLGIVLLKEGQFSRANVHIFQKARTRLKSKHPEAAKELDFVLSTGQDKRMQHKIKRLKNGH